MSLRQDYLQHEIARLSTVYNFEADEQLFSALEKLVALPKIQRELIKSFLSTGCLAVSARQLSITKPTAYKHFNLAVNTIRSLSSWQN